MEIRGVRSLALSKLVLPDDMPARQKTVNANDLGADLQRWKKYIHDPLVRESDLRIIAGRDRIAGALRIGLEKLDVKLCECSDEEAELLELAENLHRRRDDQGELQRQWLATIQRQIETERAGAPVRRGPGRPPTTRGEARAALAEKLGVSKSAIEKVDRRAEPAWGADEEEEVQEPEAPPEACVTSFGLDVPPTVDARARRVQQAIDLANGLLVQLSTIINGLEGTGASNHDVERVRGEYKRFAYELRGLRPESTCFWCKGLRSEGCAGCYETGYATAAQARGDVPAALRQEGERAMVADGKGGYRLLAPKSGPRPQAPSRRLKVQDADGNPLEVPEADE